MTVTRQWLNENVEVMTLTDDSVPSVSLRIMRRKDGEVVIECPLNTTEDDRRALIMPEIAHQLALFLLGG